MRIFITHLCPKDKIIEYGFSLSASYFNYNLIEGGGFDKIYSIYPGFAGARVKEIDNDIFEAVYSPWRYKKGIRQKLARFIEQIKIFKKIPRKSNVWFYNVTTLNLLLIFLLKWVKPSCKLFVIMLDYAPDEAFHKFALRFINRMHGRICLSNYKGFNSKNSVCLPGVIPIENNIYKKIKSIEPVFFLSGALKENITMLGMILDAFAEMPDCILHISGILCDHKEKLYEYTSRYPNIIFHGKMPYEDFESLLYSIPFSLNTRKPSAVENECNFPSKVIEALRYNRIIISTIKYPQLKDFNYFYVGSTKEEFKASIQSILKRPTDELMKYANQGERAFELFNAKKWFNIMGELEKSDSYEK